MFYFIVPIQPLAATFLIINFFFFFHPLNGLFSGTTWVSRHQKGKTILDFNEARDDGVAGASAGPYANHMRLASDR